MDLNLKHARRGRFATQASEGEQLEDIPRLHIDEDLRLPNLSWGIFLVSILGLFLETLFIRWIGTEIRIFAYLQNTVLVVCFLGLGLGMFTSSKPIEIKRSLIPLTILLLLMAIPTTKKILGSTREMLSALGDLVIWFPMETSDRTSQILYLGIGLLLTYGLMILIVNIFIPLGRLLGRLMNELISRLGKPTILSVCGNTNRSMGLLALTGANAISVDQTNNILLSRSVLRDTLLFGNLDPVKTLWRGEQPDITEAVHEAKEAGVDAVWPGCDLVLPTPLANIATFVKSLNTNKMIRWRLERSIGSGRRPRRRYMSGPFAAS